MCNCVYHITLDYTQIEGSRNIGMPPPEITHDIYRWLTNLDVLPNTLKFKSSGNFELDSQSADGLQSGFLVAKLAAQLAVQKSVALNQPLMSLIKNSNTPAARVYNWNILHENFLKMDISLSKQIQKEITSGNLAVLLNFLIELHLKVTAQKKIVEKATHQIQGLTLDLKKVRKYCEISNSETLLEFMIVLICKHFNLSSKQALATLVDSAKLLAHLLVKGVRGSFEEVHSFISETNEKMDSIMYLAEKDPSTNLQLLLQMFKPTLISRQVEVAKLGINLLKLLHYEALKYNGKNIIYQLICQQNECFDFIYMGLKRYPGLSKEVVSFLLPLVHDCFPDFILTQLRRTVNNEQEYLRTLLLILEPLLGSTQGKQLFLESEVLKALDKNWDGVLAAKFRNKENSNINQEIKILYICLMEEIWLACWQELPQQQAEELLIKVAEELKKSTRSPIYSIKIPALYRLFNLIDCLASHRNKLAGLLYKKAIFLFIEHHHELETRQIILDSFSLILNKFPTIPLELLLEPLLKQLTNKQGTSYILNTHDFSFILQLCKHPKMNESYALRFLEYFSRLYTKSIIYSPLIFHIIETLTHRFCESESIQQQCIKCFHDHLTIYAMIAMSNKSNNKSIRRLKPENQQLVIDRQKKSLAIELVKSFIRLENRRIIQEIQENVLSLFLQWQADKGHTDRGLEAILVEIGDLDQMATEHRASRNRQTGNNNDAYNQDHYRNESHQQQIYNISSFEGTEARSVHLSPNRSLGKAYLPLSGVKQARRSPNLKQMRREFKSKQSALDNYESLMNRNAVKPDPRTLEEIERIKQKWKSGMIRSKALEEESRRQRVYKLNQKELLQRNLSLGYSKLPHPQGDKILFQFNSVRRNHLKDSYQPISLEGGEDRDSTSVANILQHYRKHLSTLFRKYASKSANMQHQAMMLSFTEMMRFLQKKELLTSIPKVAVNEIISNINQKKRRDRNILGGIYEEDFQTFLIYLTDYFQQYGLSNHKDEPFGLKMEKIILKMLESENFAKELFDPHLHALRKSLEQQPQIVVPEGYKKVTEVQIVLVNRVKHPYLMNVDGSYLACMEVLGEVLEQALGITLMSPFTELLERTFLLPKHKLKNVRLIPQSTQKYFKADRFGSEEKELSSVNRTLNNKSLYVSEDLKGLKGTGNAKSYKHLRPKPDPSQKLGKDPKTELKAKRLKLELERLRQQKKQKQKQEEVAQKLRQERDKKKENSKKQYLEENRRKIQEAKKQADQQSREAKKKQEEEKRRKKAESKAKGAELLERERKNIQEQYQKVVKKSRQEESNYISKEKMLRNISKDKKLQDQKKIGKEQKMKDLLISNSLLNGELGQIVKEHHKHFTELFESYWIWDKQKMDLKGFAQLLKDFKVSQDYVSTKTITEVFKSVAKGQLVGFDSFVECIAKLAYKSQSIKERYKEIEQKHNESQQDTVHPQYLKHMITLLRLDEKNYKQIVSQVRGPDIR